MPRKSAGSRRIQASSASPHTHRRSIEQALADAGAQALLDKSTLRSTLIDAIAAVAEGKHYPEDSAFPDVSDSTETTHSAAIHLTSAEQRIITLSMGHRTSRQIADELGISIATVFSHRRNIKRKFGVKEWHEVIAQCHALHVL